MKISMYKNSTDNVGAEVEYMNVLKAISGGKYQYDIQNLRAMDNSLDSYAESKRLLPSVTFAGTFHKRAATAIKDISGMIILDVDHLTEKQITDYKESFGYDDFIHACFISPGGLGLKILIKLSIVDPSNFLSAFLSLEAYFKEKYALSIDKSGKDISRLCYVSYDEFIYINEDSKHYKFNVTDIPVSNISSFDNRPDEFKGHVISKDCKYIFDVCEKWTQRHHQYEQGNRNNYIHILACNLNRAGVDYRDAVVIIYNNYCDLPFSEIETTIKSAYRKTSEHNTVDVYDLDAHPEDDTKPDLSAEDGTIYDDTITLLRAGIKNSLIAKLIKNFGIAFFGMEEDYVSKIMNEAVKADKNDVSCNTLNLLSAEEALLEAIESYQDSGGISTLVQEMDDALNGGLMPGGLYGFIGKGGSLKSILAQCIGAENSKRGGLTVYLNGEMSALQLLDRMLNKELKIELLHGLRDGSITKDDTIKLASELESILKSCFKMISNSGWSEEIIIKTIKSVEKITKKKVSLIIVDGLTQMENSKNDEIKSAIHNSGVLKNVAKETNSAVVVLVHVSGGIEKHVRDTSKYVRGGDKILNNMDCMFCTSLLIDETSSDIKNGDLMYRKNMFYLRMIDKRGSGDIISKIIQVNRPMEIKPLELEPSTLEVIIS